MPLRAHQQLYFDIIRLSRIERIAKPGRGSVFFSRGESRRSFDSISAHQANLPLNEKGRGLRLCPFHEKLLLGALEPREEPAPLEVSERSPDARPPKPRTARRVCERAQFDGNETL